MTTLAQKRTAVANLYSGETWTRRVARMSDEQVIAIYLKQVVKPLSAPVNIPVAVGLPHEHEDEFDIY